MYLFLCAYLFSCSVFVIDGDTLVIGREHVRLWGIDAPEVGTEAGVTATEALQHIVYGGRLRCFEKDTDRYGRTVAQCFVDGVDVAGELVAGGYAEDWPYFSGGLYRDRQEKGTEK